MGIYGSSTDHDQGTKRRKAQGSRRVSAAIRHSFAQSVSPKDREPGPVHRVFCRERDGQ